MKKFLLLLSSMSLASLLATSVQAESLIDGVYKSAGDANGNGQCTLMIRAVDQTHKYGDDIFELESSGEGACEWTAVGVSKSYAITAGLVTNGGTPAFVKLTFPFGPAGKKVEVTSYEVDGTLRNQEAFTKTDSNLLADN